MPLEGPNLDQSLHIIFYLPRAYFMLKVGPFLLVAKIFSSLASLARRNINDYLRLEPMVAPPLSQNPGSAPG